MARRRSAAMRPASSASRAWIPGPSLALLAACLAARILWIVLLAHPAHGVHDVPVVRGRVVGPLRHVPLERGPGAARVDVHLDRPVRDRYPVPGVPVPGRSRFLPVPGGAVPSSSGILLTAVLSRASSASAALHSIRSCRRIASAGSRRPSAAASIMAAAAARLTLPPAVTRQCCLRDPTRATPPGPRIAAGTVPRLEALATWPHPSHTRSRKTSIFSFFVISISTTFPGRPLLRRSRLVPRHSGHSAAQACLFSPSPHPRPALTWCPDGPFPCRAGAPPGAAPLLLLLFRVLPPHLERRQRPVRRRDVGVVVVRLAPLHVLDPDPCSLEGLPLRGDRGAQPAVLGAQPAVLGGLGGEIRPQP